jgi:hypothetical protein
MLAPPLLRRGAVGIDANLVYLLAMTAKTHGLGGRLCTLGVQEVRPAPAVIAASLTAAGLSGLAESRGFSRGDSSTFHKCLGFESSESIDISDFEGCTHLFDLNAPGVPATLAERFDAVYNGGTLEHIFDLRAGLRNVFELLRPTGVAIHAGPVNGWVDHGLYQFSPTLLLDYYFANRFDILEMRLVQTRPGNTSEAIVHSYAPGAFDGRSQDDFAGQWLFYAAFRKRVDSTWAAIPQQRLYTVVYGAANDVTTAPRLRYEAPFVLDSGIPRQRSWSVTALPAPAHATGFEWVIPLPHLQHVADDDARCVSPLMLYEDGHAIGPPHAIHDAIRRLGSGRYSHWTDSLRFSPSRNDDARQHQYAYACVDWSTLTPLAPGLVSRG